MFKLRLVFFIIPLMISLLSCTSAKTKPEDDPLKNTRRLVKEGHISLYENGALNVPNTQLMLIPPGPDAVDFALELAGVKARQSFLMSLANARDAVYMVADGTRRSFELAQDIVEGSDAVANYITSHSRPGSRYLVYRAYPATRHIMGETFQFSESLAEEITKVAHSLREESNRYAQGSLNRQKTYESFAGSSASFTVWAVTESVKDLDRDIKNVGARFVRGYVVLPGKWEARDRKKVSWFSRVKRSLRYSLKTREDLSEHFTDIIVDTGSDYAGNVSESLRNSKEALASASDTGVGLAALDSMRWLLQALLWDATIAPVSKLGFASVGYVTSNAVIFPVMVVAGEGITVTQVAVEVVVDSVHKTIDVIAPTFEAALASTYAVSSFAVKSVGGVALGATGVAGSVAVGVTDSLTALTIQSAGNVAGYGVEYIGVPLVTAGVNVTGSGAGVVLGSAQAVAGTTLYLGGETSAAAARAAGYAGAGSVAVSGTMASVAGGSSLGVYELAKAIALPVSYELGGGIVLGYGSMSHIAAHTILAAADAAYLVLSLEGPNWVVYAVKGNLGNGENLTPGTVLDLKEMQNAGEEFSVLPASELEMQGLVHEVQNDLPVEAKGPQSE